MFSFFKTLFSPIVAILDFVTKYFKSIVFLTIVYFVFFSSNEDVVSKGNFANLQKISLIGQIIDVEKLLEDIEKAKNDSNIKGVLFEVDSPGGAVAPSVEIAYAIKELRELKPVVTYASGTIASGSYYAAIWSNTIIANPGSMVGSIGVIIQGFNAKDLLDKIGIQTQTVKVGKYKESGTLTREWTQDEQTQLESVAKSTYDMFINDVSTARNLKEINHTIFADAKIFTASQALEVGLVDEVATINYAKSKLIELSGVENPIWKREDKFEKFMDKLMNQVISKVITTFSSTLKAY